MKLFTIHDNKSETFNQPFFARTNPEAIRYFGQMVNDRNPNNLLALSPTDFTLYSVGEFDEASGILSGAEPQALCNGKDVKIEQ